LVIIEAAVATPKDQTSLVTLVKQGELYQWNGSSTGKTNQGLVGHMADFIPIWFVVDQFEIYIYKSAMVRITFLFYYFSF